MCKRPPLLPKNANLQEKKTDDESFKKEHPGIDREQLRKDKISGAFKLNEVLQPHVPLTENSHRELLPTIASGESGSGQVESTKLKNGITVASANVPGLMTSFAALVSSGRYLM